MSLEGRPRDCFTGVFVLKHDGRAIGELRGRWWNERLEVRLLGHRRLRLIRHGFLGNEFTLSDMDTGELLGSAGRRTAFSSTWSLGLDAGSGRFYGNHIFSRRFSFEINGERMGWAEPIGSWQRGWLVHCAVPLSENDLLLIGLIYHVILKRRQRASSG